MMKGIEMKAWLGLLLLVCINVVVAAPVVKAKKVAPKPLFMPQANQFEMVKIPSGTYVMGCQQGRDTGCFESELPAHTVKIASFELGKTEVTRAQWIAIMGKESEDVESDLKRKKIKVCGNNCPIESVTWAEVQTFIQTLNEKTGKHYRLPTEAEWEYAYRAGTHTPFYTGACITPEQATYNSQDDGFNNCGGRTSDYEETTWPVAIHPANPWGLFDMAGGVWEWMQDVWHDNYVGAPTDGSAWETDGHSIERVLRGGSWASGPRDVRAAVRTRFTSASRNVVAGFRLARSLP